MKKLNVSTPIYPNIYILIDNEDFKYLNQWKWGVSKQGDTLHIVRYQQINKKRKKIYLHRAICKAKTGEYVDHINHNILDNRRCNLRICSNSQNNMNKGLQKNNTTGFKGIYKYTKRKVNPWAAQITAGKKDYFLGYFSTKNGAAKAYNDACLKYHKEFAYLNKI